MIFDFLFQRSDPAQLNRIEASLATLTGKANRIMDDLSKLQSTFAALKDEFVKVKGELKALAQAVVDLKSAGGSQQGAIDALTTQAQGVLDDMTTSETAAETQSGVIPAPEPAPGP